MTIRSLEERLQEREDAHKALCDNEHAAEHHLNHIKALNLTSCEINGLSVYVEQVFLHLSIKNLDDFELELPKLSELFYSKWTKEVSKTNITYSLSADDLTLRATYYPLSSDTCRIIPHSTGRIRKESKWIEIEVPEIDYIIDCTGTDTEQEDTE
jgi:hypothetical protein